MKSISIVCMTLTLLCAVSALGQGVPRVLDYQGKLTNSSGQPVSDGAYQVTFKFYFVETGGSPTWTSSTISVNTSGGIFTTSIASIPASVFSSSNVWLETVWGGETLA
ncbi:MAG: hypothetical protein HYX78_14690, partial [Armatimonadetes bacterium]|nr:hypothetical protein [Armatimonadota bacterium]